MPMWVLLYFTGYVAFSILAHLDDLCRREINLWTVFEAVGNSLLLLPALAYWYPDLHSVFGTTMVASSFFFGVVSLMAFAYRGVRKNLLDRDLSLAENIGLSAFSTILLIAVSSPLIWWGCAIIYDR